MTGFQAVQRNLRFQGQYLDRESGLYYSLFRYYDPVSGRFTQPDPIGLAGGINTHAYVTDPITFVDPFRWKGCSVREGDGITHDIQLVLMHKHYKQTFVHIKDVIISVQKNIFTIQRTMAAANNYGLAN
ncbi:RHS repeat-associated core domain-containing protein [Erwinia sp. PsM31]|nr:RHS repeat-associated core domain-containing protein [Erwinia sp. PsM31]MDN4628106.1 RHS repeat-associated core domain-containing protein [Erwinia sp. PsM31]